VTKAQDNVAVVRRGFDAFNKGDEKELRAVIAADCVHHIPGDNRFSGDHKGIDNMLAVYAEMGALTEGTVHAKINDIYANDRGATVTYTLTATRSGKKLSERYALSFQLVDGRATDMDEATLDGKVDDAFWA
jgi:ketosteroid isomerase-like protein